MAISTVSHPAECSTFQSVAMSFTRKVALGVEGILILWVIAMAPVRVMMLLLSYVVNKSEIWG